MEPSEGAWDSKAWDFRIFWFTEALTWFLTVTTSVTAYYIPHTVHNKLYTHTCMRAHTFTILHHVPTIKHTTHAYYTTIKHTTYITHAYYILHTPHNHHIHTPDMHTIYISYTYHKMHTICHMLIIKYITHIYSHKPMIQMTHFHIHTIYVCYILYHNTTHTLHV